MKQLPKSCTGKVAEKFNETPDVLMATLEFPDPFTFIPGQWVMVFDDRGNKRPYSIASPPGSKAIKLCVKVVPSGVLSQYFLSLEKGDMVKLAGPYGVFTIQVPLKLDTVFIATGTGIAPFLSMLPAIFEAGTEKEVWLFFGAKTEKDLICRRELEYMERENKNFHYIPVLSRQEWDGRMGRVQQALREPLE